MYENLKLCKNPPHNTDVKKCQLRILNQRSPYHDSVEQELIREKKK